MSHTMQICFLTPFCIIKKRKREEKRKKQSKASDLESWNMLGWKGPMRIIKSKSLPCTGLPMSYTPWVIPCAQDHCLKASWTFGAVTTFLGSLFQCPATLWVIFFPDIQPKVPSTRLHAISLGRVTGCESEEISTDLSTSPCEYIEDPNKVFGNVMPSCSMARTWAADKVEAHLEIPFPVFKKEKDFLEVSV